MKSATETAFLYAAIAAGVLSAGALLYSTNQQPAATTASTRPAAPKVTPAPPTTKPVPPPKPPRPCPGPNCPNCPH